ncbi:hypothetical protein H0H92_008054 [Tricholoma furcatifolium]|nr:hypothetical protein H0H92_008054 [Tricholoma furcatifolium]
MSQQIFVHVSLWRDVTIMLTDPILQNFQQTSLKAAIKLTHITLGTFERLSPSESRWLLEEFAPLLPSIPSLTSVVWLELLRGIPPIKCPTVRSLRIEPKVSDPVDAPYYIQMLQTAPEVETVTIAPRKALRRWQRSGDLLPPPTSTFGNLANLTIENIEPSYLFSHMTLPALKVLKLRLSHYVEALDALERFAARSECELAELSILGPKVDMPDFQEGLVRLLRLPSVQTVLRLEIGLNIEDRVVEVLTWPENVLDGVVPRLEDLTILHCAAKKDGIVANLIHSRWNREVLDSSQAMLKRVVFEFDEPHRHSKDIEEFQLLRSLGLDLKWESD